LGLARVARRGALEWLRPRLGTRRRRLQTHPLKTRLERDRLARGLDPSERALLSKTDSRIAPHDAMYVGNGVHYFSVGLSAIRAIEGSITAAGTGTAAPQRILDMPSGHGRVLRFLRGRYRDAAITACDLDSDGVAFCAHRFGARPQHSSTDLETLDLPGGPFDLIWCGSLVTHLDAEANAALLALFARLLAPTGVAVLTTHGALVADRLRAGDTYQLDPRAARAALHAYDATGFGYADYPWSPGYGVSVSSVEWIGAAADRAGLNVAHTIERGWDDHQDVIALAHRESRRKPLQP
jgi:SAM-dependent methyltransferase